MHVHSSTTMALNIANNNVSDFMPACEIHIFNRLRRGMFDNGQTKEIAIAFHITIRNHLLIDFFYNVSISKNEYIHFSFLDIVYSFVFTSVPARLHCLVHHQYKRIDTTRRQMCHDATPRCPQRNDQQNDTPVNESN